MRRCVSEESAREVSECLMCENDCETDYGVMMESCVDSLISCQLLNCLSHFSGNKNTIL